MIYSSVTDHPLKTKDKSTQCRTGFCARTSTFIFSISSLTMWRWPYRADLCRGAQPSCKVMSTYSMSHCLLHSLLLAKGVTHICSLIHTAAIPPGHQSQDWKVAKPSCQPHSSVSILFENHKQQHDQSYVLQETQL